MTKPKIFTNGHTRQTSSWHDLPADEQTFFDYAGAQDSDYVEYRKTWYDLGEFLLVTPQQATLYEAGWQGYMTDTFFSAVLIKYNEDMGVIVGYTCP